MATAPLIDLEALLAPIPGDNPGGASLRFAGDYDEINQLRPKADRDALEAGGQAGQWPKIVEAATKKLAEKSKDLYLASWLTEALVHLHGFAGLRDGLSLICSLLERFWDHLYPPAEDPEVRAAPLVSLLEKNAPMWVGEVPLTRSAIDDPETGDAIPVTFNLWQAIYVHQLEDKKPLEGPMTDAFGNTPTAFLQNLRDDIAEAQAALDALRILADERFGDAAPGASALRDALSACAGRINAVLSARGVGAPEAPAEGSPAEEAAAGLGSSNGAAAQGPVRSREDALRRLQEVADFFRRTEPHSPVPYLILRAVNWSRLPFDRLLVELVKDQAALQQIHSTLGIGDNTGSGGSTSSEG